MAMRLRARSGRGAAFESKVAVRALVAGRSFDRRNPARLRRELGQRVSASEKPGGVAPVGADLPDSRGGGIARRMIEFTSVVKRYPGSPDVLKNVSFAVQPGEFVYLTGHSGAGKSTVGRMVARQLNLGFVDTDDAIEARAGKAIAALFAESGEPAFRALERSVTATADERFS